MPLRRNRRQYEQLTDFDRGRIIGFREAGWSNRRIGRHLGRSDMVVARCWQQSQKVECTVAEIQDVQGTQMIAIRAIKRVYRFNATYLLPDICHQDGLQGTDSSHVVDDTLTPIVLPMLSSRPGAIYQQDNARPHTA
ncbi:HTH_38 domain-containing protein [Trichonephila clavipes]|nr:HTH_38 domain-containing protein [Trichonephila clavipes]